MACKAPSAALIAVALASLLFGCELGAENAGTFAVTFAWNDPAPSVETWVHGRVERESDGARIQVAEAPLERVWHLTSLTFSDVPHGGPYRVVIEVKGEPDKRARALYIGESEPFELRPGRHTAVKVALSLTATPSVDTTDQSGTVVIVGKTESGYVRDGKVRVSIAPRGATHLIAANDFGLRKGQREVALEELSRDGKRYLLDWDLDAGLCARPPCPDGMRSVFIQFLNERGYPSEITSASAELDRSPPDLASVSIAPSPARPNVRVTLVVNPTEPVAEPPILTVSPRDPGFSTFVQVPGGGYVAEYVPQEGEQPREQFSFSVDLIDRAGNQRSHHLAPELLVDVAAPGLSWGPDVVPSVVHDGERYTVRFELDEVADGLPLVRVGDTFIECVFEGDTRRRVVCTQVATQREGNGEFGISIEVRDMAGNASQLQAGSVRFDTLPRCGDGVLDPFELCDHGLANADLPDAPCRLDCRPPRCGDRIVDARRGEACDDGNAQAGDGCASDCSSDETCGNGVVEPAFGEACDDANLLSHDGCSSACLREGLVVGAYQGLSWKDLPSTYDSRRKRVLVFSDAALLELGDLGFQPVSSRLNPDGEAETYSPDWVVYDPARDRVVVELRGRLWEWDGSTWSERTGLGQQQPELGLDTCATYVSSHHQTFVFAGEGYDELWTWDGTYWEERVPSDGVRPPPRTAAAVAYDPRRDRLVLFGGRARSQSGEAGSSLSDTWEWDGARWHEIEAGSLVPAARHYHTMAYDPERGRIVLTGGDSTDEPSTWSDEPGAWDWDGERWERRKATRETYRPSLVYDQRAGRMLAIEEPSNDMWILANEGFLPFLSASDRPGIRLGPATTFDTAATRGILFGGYLPAGAAGPSSTLYETYSAETWVWSDSTWLPLAVAGEAPSARAFAAMAYDPLRDVSVLFGGLTGRGYPCEDGCTEQMALRDTWELRANRWSQVAAEGVAPTAGAGGMFFDQMHGRITLFASTEDGTLGVWHWDGKAWAVQAPQGEVPSARQHFAVAYDVVRSRAVLFGGESPAANTPAVLGDTWEWDGTRFHQLLPAQTPGPRSRHSLTYNATRASVIMYGGVKASTSVGEVWEWNGTAWRSLTDDSAELMGGVDRHGAFFDPVRHAVIVVGGHASSDQKPETSTRTLRFESQAFEPDCNSFEGFWSCGPRVAAEEVCADDIDGDADGLMGCDDPDCYGRCSPSCNPVWMSCDQARPRCGDGVCGGSEDCALCPTDCDVCASQCGDLLCVDGENASICPGDCAP